MRDNTILMMMLCSFTFLSGVDAEETYKVSVMREPKESYKESFLNCFVQAHGTKIRSLSLPRICSLERRNRKRPVSVSQISANTMEGIQKKVFRVAPGIEVFAFEATGWGWSGNENAYGMVIWPGAKAVSQVITERNPSLIYKGCRVVELGAGSGLCSLVCAAMGANVLATDLNAAPLQIAEAAAKAQQLPVETQTFDILGTAPLPLCDVLIAADCIYTPDLGRGLARRVLEARSRGASVIVGSDLKRPGYNTFQEELRRAQVSPQYSKRTYDLTSPLWLLDFVRGNYVQEINIY